jgi:hypothetical protein
MQTFLQDDDVLCLSKKNVKLTKNQNMSFLSLFNLTEMTKMNYEVNIQGGSSAMIETIETIDKFCFLIGLTKTQHRE